MAKDPTLPLLFNDITRSTITWTDEEFGCYMRLLIEQWDKEYIPADLNRLKRVSDSVEKHWETLIKAKFPEISEGKLANLNMEEIRAKRNFFKKKQKDNADNRYQNSAKLPAKNLPLEIEIEIEKEIEYDPEKGINNKLAEFFNYRLKKKKPIIEESKEAFLRKLKNYSGGDDKIAWEILDETISQGWQGIFKPKENGITKTNGNREERQGTVKNLKNLSEAILDDHSSKNG